MSTRRHISKKASLESTFTPAANPFKTRGFGKGIQARSAELPTTNLLQTRPFGSPQFQQPETRSIDEQMEGAESFGYNAANIPVYASETPPPIQRKEGELGNWYQPRIQRVDPVMNRLNRLQVEPFGQQEQQKQETVQNQEAKVFQRQEVSERTSVTVDVKQRIQRKATKNLAVSPHQWQSAQVFLNWVRHQKSSETGQNVKFKADDLLKEQSLLDQLNPSPKTVDELKPLLDFLVEHGVLKAPTQTEPEYVLLTTAPIARNDIKPQNIMQDELNREVQLFKNAKVIVSWIEQKGLTTLNTADLLADQATIKKLQPIPDSEVGLKPTIDLLVFYGVLAAATASGSEYSVLTNVETSKPETKKLHQANTKITEFTDQFKKRVEKEDPLQSVVATDTIPAEWSSDRKQVKQEQAMEENLNQLKSQLDEFVVIWKPPSGKTRKVILRATTDQLEPMWNQSEDTVIGWKVPVAHRKQPIIFKGDVEIIEKVKSGSDEATQKQREKVEKAIEKTENKLNNKRRYRTFSKDVVVFFNRLRKKNTDWSVGTYVGHSWGEFSADIFIKAPIKKGFWEREKVKTFFDDLNAAAEEEDAEAGQFAWRAIYNDDPLRQEVNQKYGRNRVINVPNHGPAPDHKLHIHLDITPVNLKKDEVTGYEIQNGRVQVLE